jgi:hypothetical protein
MLGGLAKANIWVAKPRGSKSFSFLPLDMLGGLAQKANLGVIRPEDIITNEYDASCHYEHAWSKRSPDLSSRLLPRAPTSRKPPR